MFATTYFKYEIISVEMDNFSVWLLQEIESRGWNQAELHRKSGLSRTVISDVLSNKVSPGYEFCIAVGKALHVPGDHIMRIAGLLPPLPERTQQIEQLIYLFERLNEKDRQTILDMMQFLLSK